MDTTQVSANGTKIVKRYQNRKLYDTEESCYVTLRDLVGFVTAGRDVRVIDNRDKSDITGQTFMQAMVETETDLSSQTETLRGIIKAGGLAKYVAAMLQGPQAGHGG